MPTQLHQLTQSQERSDYDLTSLRVMVSGAAPLATTTKTSIMDCFPGVELHELYGLTETGLITNLRPEDQMRKTRCAGQAFLNMRFEIVDAEGHELPTGEVGEIIACGPTLFEGYYADEEATACAYRDRYMHTGVSLGTLAELESWQRRNRVGGLNIADGHR